jgi:uncharacterized protein
MSDTTGHTRQVITEYIDALGRGDIDAREARWAEDSTWTLSGSGLPVSGTWTGPEEIFGKFLAQVVERLDLSAPVRQEVHRIIVEGEWAVALWTSHATARTGAAYRNDNAVVFHVVDGVIRSATEFTDTAYMQRILFAAV